MHSLGKYEELIQKRYIPSYQNGIELSSIGTKKKIGHFPIQNSVLEVITSSDDSLEACFSKITSLWQEADNPNALKLVWYKINVIDQAVNDYVGIGFLNLHRNWPKFIGALLDFDRADQSGDVLVIMLDAGFKWAVRFTLSQDTRQLRIDLYQ